MIVDHEVRNGGDGAAQVEGIAWIVVMFAINPARTGEAVSAR